MKTDFMVDNLGVGGDVGGDMTRKSSRRWTTQMGSQWLLERTQHKASESESNTLGLLLQLKVSQNAK